MADAYFPPGFLKLPSSSSWQADRQVSPGIGPLPRYLLGLETVCRFLEDFPKTIRNHINLRTTQRQKERETSLIRMCFKMH